MQIVPIGSAAHLAPMILTAGAVAAIWRWRPRDADSRPVRIVLAGIAVAAVATQLHTLFLRGVGGPLWGEALPLHLCDIVLLCAAGALVFRRALLMEITYFFGLGGTVHAMLTPDVPAPFPDPAYFLFFLGHAVIIIAAAIILCWFRFRPSRGAPVRMIALAYAYLAVAGAANYLLGTNFGYLAGKPPSGSLLDYLGPWPAYLIWVQAIGIAMILLLDLPFRRSRVPDPSG